MEFEKVSSDSDSSTYASPSNSPRNPDPGSTSTDSVDNMEIETQKISDENEEDEVQNKLPSGSNCDIDGNDIKNLNSVEHRNDSSTQDLEPPSTSVSAPCDVGTANDNDNSTSPSADNDLDMETEYIPPSYFSVDSDLSERMKTGEPHIHDGVDMQDLYANSIEIELISGEVQGKLEDIGVVDGDTQMEGSSGKVVCFVNNDAKISPSPVLQYVLDVDQPFDTIISCGDGKVGAHRLVLAAASPFIATVFSSSDHRLGEVAVMILPDIRVAVMKTLLNFCYTGSMMFPKENEKEVRDTMRLLLLGEFGKLTLKEIQVKEPTPLMSSVSNIYLEQQRAEYRMSLGTYDPSSPHRTTERAPRIRVTELLSTTSSAEESTDSDSENENDENFEPSTDKKKKKSKTKKESDERPALSTFIRNPSGATDSLEEVTEPSYDYIIAPVPSGSKICKLQCAHCPAAFKSIESVSIHLEETHGIDLEACDVSRRDLDKLLNCEFCNRKHSHIPSSNHCLSKHKKTRCYTCFESVRLKDFEQHVTRHGTKKNGMCVVKCNWCEAGIVFQSPFDNKSMFGHCFSKHFPSISNSHNSSTTVVRKMDTAGSSKDLTPSTPIPTSAPPVKTKTPSTPNTSALKMTPATSSSGRPVPKVLQMLQKASLKRRTITVIKDMDSDSDTELKKTPQKKDSSQKRLRLSGEGEIKEKVHMSKRTGKPIGRRVIVSELTTAIPNFKTKATANPKGFGGRVNSVQLDVGNLPKTFIKISYGKTYISDYMDAMMAAPQPIAPQQIEGEKAQEGQIMEIPSGSGCMNVDVGVVDLDSSAEDEQDPQQPASEADVDKEEGATEPQNQEVDGNNVDHEDNDDDDDEDGDKSTSETETDGENSDDDENDRSSLLSV